MLFLICAMSVSLVYFVKLIVISFLGYILKADQQVKEYFFNIFLINNFIGLLFLPLVIIMAYLPGAPPETIIKTGVGLFFASMIYRALRGVVIGSGNINFSLYHLFLYLCTLEILPLVVLIKLFVSKI